MFRALRLGPRPASAMRWAASSPPGPASSPSRRDPSFRLPSAGAARRTTGCPGPRCAGRRPRRALLQWPLREGSMPSGTCASSPRAPPCSAGPPLPSRLCGGPQPPGLQPASSRAPGSSPSSAPESVCSSAAARGRAGREPQTAVASARLCPSGSLRPSASSCGNRFPLARAQAQGLMGWPLRSVDWAGSLARRR